MDQFEIKLIIRLENLDFDIRWCKVIMDHLIMSGLVVNTIRLHNTYKEYEVDNAWTA